MGFIFFNCAELPKSTLNFFMGSSERPVKHFSGCCLLSTGGVLKGIVKRGKNRYFIHDWDPS